MAFRTNKVPAIEERSVSGSSVSFNSAFALPLKACKVSFSATQAGSGDPSPSNPRAISGVSAIGLTANSTPVSVSLGDTRYGGELDVLTGELTLDYILKSVNKDDVILAAVGDIFYVNNFFPIADDRVSTQSNILKRASNQNTTQEAKDNLNDFEFCCTSWAGTPRRLFIKDSTHSTLDSFKAWLVDNPIDILVRLATPITIQLSANELSSIIGNNTFSTDTGILEITFADLQEKSASGAVATFNTALAMPLSSCNIAVNAWQEGSGDPSPSNIRPIHGFSEVNVTRAGKNLFDKTKVTYSKWVNLSTGAIEIASSVYCISDYILLKKGITYYIPDTKTPRRWIYDLNKNPISAVSTNSFTPTSDCYLVITVYTVLISVDVIQIEVGSTATSYEPYTGNIYTIQLGQEVYGAEVDVVNGVAHVTHSIVDLGSLSWQYGNFGPNMLFYATISDIKQNGDVLSDIYEQTVASVSSATFLNYKFRQYGVNKLLFIRNDDYTDTDIFKTDMGGHKCVYELATPFDIQLSDIPTLSTNIGNNTIFADTGDVDLTYKDLDIAKRGNFREVFKLPS